MIYISLKDQEREYNEFHGFNSLQRWNELHPDSG